MLNYILFVFRKCENLETKKTCCNYADGILCSTANKMN